MDDPVVGDELGGGGGERKQDGTVGGKWPDHKSRGDVH